MMPNRFCLLLAVFLPLSILAQQADSLLKKKMVYQDYLYLNNIYKGSQNPTAISREALENVAEINASYRYALGDYHAMDESNIQKKLDFSLYGIKKFKKVAFEGEIAYSNISEQDKRWNSTLFIAKDNPFVIADSIYSNFGTEKFHLNGGFSYEPTSKLHIGLRADYKVGSTANQTDPRPLVDGMRFYLNPGIDYQLGQFTIGLSGRVEWMSEASAYTVVRTTEGAYYAFLFHGLGDPVMKSIIGYQRKYSGNLRGGNIQLIWQNNRFKNFFEVGLQKSTEEAEDGGDAEKYKGGKYKASQYGFTDRFVIYGDKWIHNLNLKVFFNQVNGTYYQQEQHSTSDGNIVWDIISSSVCHKDTHSDVSLEYRLDRITHSNLPHFTVGIKGGMFSQKVNHYPELYLQKYNMAYGEIYVKKLLSLKKYSLILHGNVAYAQRLTQQNAVEGTVLEDKYNTPQFEYISGDYLTASIKAELQHPLTIRKFSSSIGGFAEFTYSSYLGNYYLYEETSRNNIRAGIKLIF